MASLKGEIHPVDILIGRNISDMRVRQGMSMEALGGACSRPVSFQQVQKYEAGINRVSGSKLAEFAFILGCQVQDFFVGVAELLAGGKVPEMRAAVFDRKDGVLVKAYHQLPPGIQDAVREMVSALAADQDTNPRTGARNGKR